MRKRILALILALVMCLSLLPAGALADDVIAEGTDKDISWSLDTNGTLTVSGTGSIQYEYSTAPWKPYAADIKALVVGEGITMIGKKAFDHLENLETISLPSGFMRIYDSAFSSCTSLKSIVIPEGVKSIGNSAFSSCTSLKSIVIPEGVTSVGTSAFSHCESLESVSLLGSYTRIPENCFMYCKKLKSIEIPEGVKEIGKSAFFGSGLTEVRFPASLESIGGGAFAECQLTEIVIPDSVTILANAFYDNDNLKSAVIGKGLAKLGDDVFFGCNDLTCVSFGSNIKEIVDPFRSCNRLTHIFFDGTDEQFERIKLSAEFEEVLPYLVIVTDSSCEDTDKCGDTLTWRLDGDTLKIEGTGKMYDYDGDYEAPWARYGNKILNVELPEGLESIGSYAMDCLPLVESICIPASVSSIPPMPFLYCSSLKSITVDENNPCFTAQDGVLYSKDMTTLLSYPICKSDETFTFHSGLQYFEQLSMFANLDLKSVNVDAGNPYFSSDNGLVYDKEQKEFLFMPYSTTKLVFPDTVERIADNAVITGKNLTSVKFSASFKKTIDPSYFIGCTNLKSVTVDSNNKYYTSDKDVLFSKDKKTLVWYPQAKSASSYTIPSGVTTIGDYAFLYTEDLEELTVPNTLTSIGSYAFYMSGIKKFVFHGSSGQLNRIKILEGNDVLATVKVEVDSYAPGLTGTTSSGKPKLSWDKVEGATNYELYRATSKSGKYTKLTTVTGTSYTDKSAEIGKTYYYKVRGTATISGQKAYSDYSEIVSVKCTPAAPTVTLSVVTSSGKIKLSWKAIDGAAKYEVYRATSSNGTYKKLTTTTKTSYTNTSATAGTKYYYKVRALSSAGTAGNYSSVKNIICDLAQPVVTLSNVSSSGKIKVSWKAIDGAEKYEVYRATSSSGTYKKLTSTTSTSYTDTSAKAGSKYYYKVKAICSKTSDGNSAYSAVVNRICDLAKPTAKIALKSGHPKVTWAKIDGASKYEVYRATSKSGTYTKLTTTSSASYTDKKAKAGKTYYYKVKAVCSKTSDGNSAYSSIVSIKAK